jgi:hypothetical protein
VDPQASGDGEPLWAFTREAAVNVVPRTYFDGTIKLNYGEKVTVCGSSVRSLTASVAPKVHMY